MLGARLNDIMFTIKAELLRSLYNDDTIYHYTKTSTAIDYIFFNQQLRFSKSLNSSDPIESRKAHRSTVYFNAQADRTQTQEEYEDVNSLHKYVENFETNFHQICFCKNSLNDDIEYITRFKGFEEFFGFTKLRMWDQYADKYSGICIAFSKSKILELNKDKIKLFFGDIKYLSFEDISLKKIGNIQGNHLLNVGKEYYQEQLKEQIIDSLFLKHQDYSTENEFRIGTFFDKEKASVEFVRDEPIFYQSMMLEITDCVKAIFMSSFVNDKQKEELLNYSNKLNVDLIEIKWKYNSIELIDYKKNTEFYNSF